MGVATFVGIQHLWFWLGRREDSVHLWMVGLCVGTLTYLAGFRLQMFSPIPGPAILGARLQWTGGTGLVVVLFGLVNRFIGRRSPPRALRPAVTFGAVYVFCVWFTDTVVRNEAALRDTLAGEHYWGVARGPIMFAFLPFLFTAAFYCLGHIARARHVDRLERSILLVAFSFYLLVGINEVLFALRLIRTMRLFPPAFALLAVAFSVLLGRRFNGLAGQNEALLAATRAQAAVLEAKNKELDSFVYTVSHDLKSPLVSIRGMVDIVHEDDAARLGDDGRHALDRIRANVDRMARLIADLLIFSRAGREGRPRQAVRLPDVVDAILDELGGTIREHGITVVRRDEATVWGIPSQLEQVFRNLIGNAVKFMGDTTAPAIEVRACGHGDMVECAVHDNGIGIDPAYHTKIFEMFQRLGDVPAEGTGVGLALVQKIVESNGGRIRVESAPGQGARFTFTWPGTGQDLPASPVAESAARAS
jgi:signal transduction histidine kinase